MIQLFRDLQFKYKLILCFLTIILINVISGSFSIKTLREIEELVYVTYDRALMSGTFSQAVKFDYANFDSDVKSALLVENPKEFQKQTGRSTKSSKVLLEDLQVVKERALSSEMNSLIAEIRSQLVENKILKEELLNEKSLLLQKGFHDAATSLSLWKKWESNKTKKLIYRKLTGISDKSAEVGYDFRLSSESKNKKSLSLVIWMLAITVILSLLLALVIPYVIVIPLQELQKVCKQFGFGDYGIRAPVRSKDEVGSLAFSFNTMLDLIQEKNENISALLSSLPFGLFYFDRAGTISTERSRTTEKMFLNFGQYRTVYDFFKDHHCSTKQIDGILKALFEGKLPFDSAANLFPKKISVNGATETKTIQLFFKPQFNSLGALERVILLAEDVTEKIKAIEQTRSLVERVHRVSKVSDNIESFREFLPAVEHLFSALQGNLGQLTSANEVNVKRDLHTLKGLLGIYGFNSCSESLHQLETLLLRDSSDKQQKLLEGLSSTHAQFSFQARDVSDLLSINRSSELKLYDTFKINQIRDLVSREATPELLAALERLDKFPLSKVFKKYLDYTDNVLKRYENKKIQLTFDLNSDEISYEEAQQIDSALIHILRNSIDHGIEETSERLKLRKNETGEIRISCLRLQDQSLEIRVADDGKGISGEDLATKAREKGIWSDAQFSQASPEEKLQLIFVSGFSTKESVSEISGRGVGMDAVKELIESLGGAIRLSTEIGVGTTFALRVPTTEVKRLIN